MEAREPMPGLVFGVMPSFQEAKDATAELKDALDKVYLSSPESTGCVDPFAANPSVSVVSGPALEPVISDATPTPVPRHVFHALSLLSISPEAQNVIASIASDPNVWNAVMEYPGVQDYFVSLPRNDEFLDVQSPQPFEESSAESQPGNSDSGFNNIMQNIKVKVLKMVSNATHHTKIISHVIKRLKDNDSSVCNACRNAIGFLPNLYLKSSNSSSNSNNGNESVVVIC